MSPEADFGDNQKDVNNKEQTCELFDLSEFMEQKGNLDENLHEIAVMAAHILNMENCSIMLLKDIESAHDLELRVFAHSGYLPDAAHREAIKIREGISGYVAASGEALFVEDIDKSQFASQKRGRYKSKGFISAPIIIGEKVIGVINANTPKDRSNIETKDLELLKIISLLISKSVQLVQLQGVLRSKYIQFALSQENIPDDKKVSLSLSKDPGKVAKLLAKTFYHEMARAGFGPDHMITTATEILSLLSERLDKHKDRRERQ
jgi:signal transduction protein with GAF and PtsI domain